MLKNDKIYIFWSVSLLVAIVIITNQFCLFAQTSIASVKNGDEALSKAIVLGNASHGTVYHYSYTIDTFKVTNSSDTAFDNIIISHTDRVLPEYDLDISNNEHNLVANTLTLNQLPGNSDSGLFLLLNPSADDMNVDPDSFGKADLTNLTYTATNLVGLGPKITTANITITPIPLTLASGDGIVLLYKVDIPVGQSAGLYEGTVYVTSPGEDDTGDFFNVVVIVDPIESMEVKLLENASLDTVYHCEFAQIIFTVTNTGERNLDDIIVKTTGFHGLKKRNIQEDWVTYTPSKRVVVPEAEIFSTIIASELEAGSTLTVTAKVDVRCGVFAQDYIGAIKVIDDDGYPCDVIELQITVLPKYDLDIADNKQDLVANTLHLCGLPGDTVKGKFLLLNPNTEKRNFDPDPFGNADLTNLNYTLSNLIGPSSDITNVNISLSPCPTTLVSGYSEVILCKVYVPLGYLEGVYEGIVKVTSPDEDDTGDFFNVEVTVASYKE